MNLAPLTPPDPFDPGLWTFLYGAYGGGGYALSAIGTIGDADDPSSMELQRCVDTVGPTATLDDCDAWLLSNPIVPPTTTTSTTTTSTTVAGEAVSYTVAVPSKGDDTAAYFEDSTLPLSFILTVVVVLGFLVLAARMARRAGGAV